MPKPWLPEHIEIIRANAGRVEARVIAEMVGRTATHVREKMSKLKIKGCERGGQKWTPEDMETLKANVGKLASTEIGVLLNRSHTTISYQIIKMGLDGKPKGYQLTEWTPERLAALATIGHGATLDKVHAMTGLCREVISRKAKELGIVRKNSFRPNGWSEKEESTIREMAPTSTAREISVALGTRGRIAVHNFARRNGIKLKDGRNYLAPRGGTREPRRRVHASPKPKPIRVIERVVDICPLHHCPVSNWTEHKERLGCAVIPPYLRAYYERQRGEAA